MSRLHKMLIGVPRGTTGHLVFRIRRGIAFLCARPMPFIPGTKPEDIARRNKFGMACRFSAAINSVPKLKQLWERFEGTAHSYNLIAQANYKRVTADDVTGTAVITPKRGLGLSIISSVVTNPDIQIEIDSIGPKIITEVETKVRLLAILHLSDPVDEYAEKHEFIPLVTEAQNLEPLSPVIFTFELDQQNSMIYDLYTTRKLFYAIVTEDAAGNLYKYSNTYSV